MVEEHRIAFAHRPQMVPRLKVANACPCGPAVLYQIVPRVGARLLFNEPAAFTFWHRLKEPTVADRIKNFKTATGDSPSR
jgi:hypothetical protein